MENYYQIVREDKVVALAADVEIPEPYNGWITARAVAMSTALLNGVGSLLQSDQISSMFRQALGLPQYQLLNNERQLSNYNTLLPYRGSNKVDEYAAKHNLRQISNAPIYNQIGKDILHPPAAEVTEFRDLPTTLTGTNIPVLPGAFCQNKQEVMHIVNIFERQRQPYIIKDAFGTDGSNLINDIGDYSGGEVVVELAVDYLASISVQYLEGILGTLVENPKTIDNRWLGNSFGYQSQYSQIEETIKYEADEFANYLHNITGQPPVIFGMDYLVYRNGTRIERAFIDPNLRMPGNLYMYYQKGLLESLVGSKIRAMRSQLIYEEAKPFTASKLQYQLERKGIALMSHTGNGYELSLKGNHPVGIYPIIQDPHRLSMINVIGRNQNEVERLLARFYEV